VSAARRTGATLPPQNPSEATDEPTSATRMRAAAAAAPPVELASAMRALLGNQTLIALEALSRAQEEVFRLECNGDNLPGWSQLADTVGDLRMALWDISGGLCHVASELSGCSSDDSIATNAVALALAMGGE
jgi:hypothetical protein